MILFLGLLACDLVITIQMKGPSKLRIAGLVLAFIAFALTHYFTIGAFVAIASYSLIRLRGKTRGAVFLALALAFLFVLFAWSPMFWRARGLVALDNYVKGKGIGIFESFFNLPRRLLLDLSLETGFLTMLAFAAVIYLSPLARMRRYPHLLLWWLWVICVPGFLVGWDLFRHTHFISVTRYVLLASPGIYAIFATPFPTRIGKLVPAAFVLAAGASAFARWQTGPQITPDIRAAAHWIETDVPRGDPVILFGGPESEPSFDYFAIAHYAGEWNRPVVLLQNPADTSLRNSLTSHRQAWIWSREGAAQHPARLEFDRSATRRQLCAHQSDASVAKSPKISTHRIPLNSLDYLTIGPPSTGATNGAMRWRRMTLFDWDNMFAFTMGIKRRE